MLVRASAVDQLKPSRGPTLLVSRCRGPVHKRRHDRIQLVDAADVVHVGVDFVADAEIQREARIDAPVVLGVAGEVHVVGVGNHQILIRLAAPKRDGKQQVVVVDLAVAVAVERREVLDEFDSPVAEDAQIELRAHALHLTAELPLMGAALQRQRVGELPARLRRALRHTERRSAQQARERQLNARRDRRDGVVEVAEADAEVVDARATTARCVHDPSTRVQSISRLLPLRRRTDRPVERAASPHRLPAGRSSGRSRLDRPRHASPHAACRAGRRAAPAQTSAGSIVAAVSRVPTSTPPSWFLTSSDPNPKRLCRRSGPPSVNEACCRSNGGSPAALAIEGRRAAPASADRAGRQRAGSMHDVAA